MVSCNRMSGERLTTWAEIESYLSAAFGTATSVRLDFLTIVVEGTTVEVQLLDGGWLKLTAVIGSLRLLSPAEMLAHNVRAVIGTFCTRDGQLAIRQTLPLTELLAADLDEAVRSVAALAAETLARTRALA